MISCDRCNSVEYAPEDPRVFYCELRPSDPSEMCCILAGHKSCLAPDAALPSITPRGGIATRTQWREWVESVEALENHVLFLSL